MGPLIPVAPTQPCQSEPTTRETTKHHWDQSLPPPRVVRTVQHHNFSVMLLTGHCDGTFICQLIVLFVEGPGAQVLAAGGRRGSSVRRHRGCPALVPAGSSRLQQTHCRTWLSPSAEMVAWKTGLKGKTLPGSDQ